jgi:hypothetical protein
MGSRAPSGGEVLEAVLVGYSIGLGLEPRVSLTKFSDHRHLLLRGDETLNLPLGEPDAAKSTAIL